MITVYCLRRTIDNYIFYVGMSTNCENRFKQHLISSNCPKGIFIKECNKEIELIPIYSCENNSFQKARLECYYIAFFKDCGFNLLNKNTLLTRPLHKINISLAFPKVTKDIQNRGFHLLEEYFSSAIR